MPSILKQLHFKEWRKMQLDDQPTPARAPLDPAMSKFKVSIDKNIYEGNAYIVGIIMDKLYAQKADEPIAIRAIH
ncbi:hypothetical protein SARC_11907 [Sphaeroforma arctica JP610]|uniref:Uncharacterized protein n=1 Tax=Sphaeroforma arctica JP610 TaxID=667725 RepID=A0A0L0FGL0_9EUKA|nr:hypothetical protein SARC_11907 [Sphaeroforma arctica JP610]KNC75571.1 hypothetical protein SARC_11907 [Sphaeroforma arctica JP610]|eukprot:XP_014149473.1 hypothetical protein SARC_11907 [Sphaeroforma arctica JP610]